MIEMRQVVVAWNSDGSRLFILWDADIRDSFQSLPYNPPNMALIHRHLQGMIHSWKVDGFDVEQTPVLVLNPHGPYGSWQFDYNPQGNANAVVFTLI